jgi:hypothetical protein
VATQQPASGRGLGETFAASSSPSAAGETNVRQQGIHASFMKSDAVQLDDFEKNEQTLVGTSQNINALTASRFV